MKIFDITIFGLNIAPSYYGLMYIIGFIIGYIYILKKNILTKDNLESYFFYVFFGVVLGGRLGYIIFYDLSFYLQNPLQMFEVWHGGMSFHGGLAGVAIATHIFSKIKHINFWHIVDNLAVIVPVGLFFGRIGNYLNKELLGLPGYTGPLEIVKNGVSYFPSPLLEACLEGVLLFIILFILSKTTKKVGLISAVFLILYGTFRSLIEIFVRSPDPQLGELFNIGGIGISMGTLLSFIMFIIGIIILILPINASKNK